jgi:hypothetical protein
MAEAETPDFSEYTIEDLVRYIQERDVELPPEPRSNQEVAAAFVEVLENELALVKEALRENRKAKFELRKRVRDLEDGISKAKRKTKPFKARIKTLTPAWQRQWVSYYDEHIADGKPKPEAAALAWARIKVHCVKNSQGEWNCEPHEKVFKKKLKEARELRRELAGKPKPVKPATRRGAKKGRKKTGKKKGRRAAPKTSS